MEIRNNRWYVTLKCGHEAEYKSKDAAVASIKKNGNCRSCAMRIKMSNVDYSGSNNPFYGKKHTEDVKSILVEKALNRVRKPEEIEQARSQLKKVSFRGNVYDQKVLKEGKESADLWLKEFKEVISKKNTGEGNPMYGKPAPTGSGNGWKGWYNGKFFRSLRELQFMIENPSYVSAETKFWSAEYKDYKGTKRTTRPDFVDLESKTVVECKPNRLHGSYSVNLKAKAIEGLCVDRGYTYLLVDPGTPSKDVLLDLTDSGSIKWSSDYERKVREYEK